jgi:hypothetical protein
MLTIRPQALCLHPRQRETNGVKRRRQINRQRFVPVLGSKVLDWTEIANDSIVHQNVQPTVPLLCDLDQLGDLRGLPQVGTVVLGAHTQPPETPSIELRSLRPRRSRSG